MSSATSCWRPISGVSGAGRLWILTQRRFGLGGSVLERAVSARCWHSGLQVPAVLVRQVATQAIARFIITILLGNECRCPPDSKAARESPLLSCQSRLCAVYRQTYGRHTNTSHAVCVRAELDNVP